MGFKLVVTISNTDPAPLLILQSMYGGDLHLSNRKNINPNHKKVYAWKLATKDGMKTFLQAIEPHCRVKGTQMRVALKYLATVEKPGSRLQQGAWDIRLQCYEEMKEINKRGTGLGHRRQLPLSPSLAWNPAHRESPTDR